MSDEQAANTAAPQTSDRSTGASNTNADGIDMAALAAAVERLLRRDLEVERERLGADQWRKPL